MAYHCASVIDVYLQAYIPNFIRIGETFCTYVHRDVWMYVRTDVRLDRQTSRPAQRSWPKTVFFKTEFSIFSITFSSILFTILLYGKINLLKNKCTKWINVTTLVWSMPIFADKLYCETMVEWRNGLSWLHDDDNKLNAAYSVLNILPYFLTFLHCHFTFLVVARGQNIRILSTNCAKYQFLLSAYDMIWYRDCTRRQPAS